MAVKAKISEGIVYHFLVASKIFLARHRLLFLLSDRLTYDLPFFKFQTKQAQMSPNKPNEPKRSQTSPNEPEQA